MKTAKRPTYLLDANRSFLSRQQIKTFREQITKQKNNPVCKDMSTFEVSAYGALAIVKDNFSLAKEQLDV